MYGIPLVFLPTNWELAVCDFCCHCIINGDAICGNLQFVITVVFVSTMAILVLVQFRVPRGRYVFE